MLSEDDKKILPELTFRAPSFEEPKNDAGFGKEAFGADTRDPYQRDLGRIVHSASFRRLQTKTQVMGTGEGDFHRTRLTHSLEVGQIGRGIVWNLLARRGFGHADTLPSTELIEAICYAHDLGHPPFGHGGERALYKAMYNFGGFEGNAQTIRILSRLEKYYRGNGIAPTRRLLLGVLKYPVAFGEYPAYDLRKPPKCFYDSDLDLVEGVLDVFSLADREEFRRLGSGNKPMHKSLDCSIMELADDIAYGVHDLEDGVGRGILRREEIGEPLERGFQQAGVGKIREVTIPVLLDKLFSSDACERKHAISLLVGFFVVAIDVARKDVFQSQFLDLNARVEPNIRYLLNYLSKDITFKSLVGRREVQTLEFKGEKIIADLFAAFEERPVELMGLKAIDPYGEGFAMDVVNRRKLWRELPPAERDIFARAISDFIAGMTNPYAEKYHRRLFDPGFGSSTDEL
ncbi:dNTP triphosphohydrolase [Mesorhizobium sp. M1C.F.Ca.ET.193.01.1.1]|uniref:anti-phage deoxyguanosine triphosphatase n=3 Tax=Mesorhizobium TaxID=68287 RepID=UPI000FD3EC19|nr:MULTISPECIES: anti-phage deoxyguanosine triphosphatase [unclassified Mesorhizobium]TGS95554.1 dNTP triphosphohydrolase [bacterium M00.F.Ca.ET.177.01.1.1]TGQ51631.1 dNTP triphosphohydrolase [Mesorhizobium sp. M1C.F.Ca.ET.210.01.1.1]TGQ67861.1 dNTP triphosphohydrolase [Mesorhizobium sp. M1C.F.Ca.ET.212.01.1.1]TGR02450.1 dNTP triphosphohydrolase [Mesorhizobium sp. M1C.F.Ca.ET.204.01.1.1]TGR23493.1 dNTP triphosphohydrolase [Mesorhizobium sp. M1C.F.Ca.ET.196.01.1.1]